MIQTDAYASCNVTPVRTGRDGRVDFTVWPTRTTLRPAAHMNSRDLCRSLLALADSIPSGVPWGVTDVSQDGLVFVHDARDESTTIIMEAVAGRFGEVVAVESIPSVRIGYGPLLGCLVRVDGDASEMAGILRGAYAIATTEADPDSTGPF